MIRIDRTGGARALRTLVDDGRAALARGSSIVIFPEGTRAPVGERNPYQPGVAALYRQLDCPVVPVALNSGLFWRRRGFIKRPGRIVVEFLPPIAPGLERKAFMAELEQRLERATDRLIAEGRPGRSPLRRSRSSWRASTCSGPSTTPSSSRWATVLSEVVAAVARAPDAVAHQLEHARRRRACRRTAGDRAAPRSTRPAGGPARWSPRRRRRR